MALSVKLVKKASSFTLDIELQAGAEIVVLFGSSGSGKTMTLKLIAGLMKPDDGYVRFDGEPVFDNVAQIDLPPQKRFLGYVFQNYALFPHLTVEQNIMFGAKGVASDKQSQLVENMLAAFRLENIRTRFPHQISGGQQQRTAVARALIRNPRALLLDEPFSALDNPLRIKMRECLKNLIKQFHIPILLVTHDILEAYTMADRLLIYENGRIIQNGKPQDVFQHPANEYVRELVDTTAYAIFLSTLHA